jgi:hypothetical protein
MFIAYVVVAAVMSLALLASASAKFARSKMLIDQMATLRLPTSMLPFLAVAQVAGAGGLIIGLWWGPLGIAAAVGVTLYFIGAVITHLRVGDYKGSPQAAVLGVIAIALIVLRATTL